MMRRDDEFSLFEVFFDEIDNGRCCDEDVVVIQAGDRVIDEEVRRLLTGPSIDIEKCEKEAPDKYSFFAAGDFDRDFLDLVWIVVVGDLFEEKNGLVPFLRVVVGDKAEPISGSVTRQLFSYRVFVESLWNLFRLLSLISSRVSSLFQVNKSSLKAL